MPIYEYECGKCGKTIEVIQKMTDKPLKKHESCGGPLTKLISASGFQFKGTGWYVTDYPKKSSRDSSRNGDSSEKSGGKDEKSKDEKSKSGATKSDTSKSDSSKSETSHRKSEKK